jgi:hypothetical protein
MHDEQYAPRLCPPRSVAVVAVVAVGAVGAVGGVGGVCRGGGHRVRYALLREGGRCGRGRSVLDEAGARGGAARRGSGRGADRSGGGAGRGGRRPRAQSPGGRRRPAGPCRAAGVARGGSSGGGVAAFRMHHGGDLGAVPHVRRRPGRQQDRSVGLRRRGPEGRVLRFPAEESAALLRGFFSSLR